LGLVSSGFLIRQWRYAIVVAFILGAVFTPPDPLSQFMLAIPLLALYCFSIGIVMVIERSRRSAPAPVDTDPGASAV
jgi:sec-independent protein translocase protein TatC